MEHRHFAIIDPAMGISGDMLLGALIAAGAPREWLQGLPGRLGFPEVRVAIEEVDRCGVTATKVTVTLPGGAIEPPAELVHSEHHHASHQHAAAPAGLGRESSDPLHEQLTPHGQGSYRRLGDLIALIEHAPLSEWVRSRAVHAFRLLGDAEGRVHGLPPEQVHLHEVGAVDAVIDIVGVIEGFERLNLTTVYHRPLALGAGWIRAAHGTMPVPAPATAVLIEGLEVAPNGPVTGEATTPTGAALLRVLSSGSPPARWRAGATGWGAGGRNPSGYPNALRLILAESAGEAGQTVMLATDIDDLNPEYLDPLREALTAAGALDVQLWATQMKKGRTGFRVEITTTDGEVEAVTDALFRHSTTTGVRRWRSERITLPRREIHVVISGTAVRVKVVDTPHGVRCKPEYDDIAALALRLGRPAQDVALEVQQRAMLIAGQPAGDGSSSKKEQ